MFSLEWSFLDRKKTCWCTRSRVDARRMFLKTTRVFLAFSAQSMKFRNQIFYQDKHYLSPNFQSLRFNCKTFLFQSDEMLWTVFWEIESFFFLGYLWQFCSSTISSYGLKTETQPLNPEMLVMRHVTKVQIILKYWQQKGV